jgi:hypothetical protein
MVVEFVMIVVGVLLALAADSALERRGLREQAQAALQGVRHDVERDVDALAHYWAPELLEQEEARVRLTAFLRGTAPIADSVQFVRDVRNVASYTTLDPNTAAIEELKSSGGLQLIGDPELRSSILRYLNDVENIQEFDVLHRALFLELYAEVATSVVRGLALPESFRADNALGDEDTGQRVRNMAAGALDARSIRSSGDLERLLAGTGQPFMIKADRYRALRDSAVSLIGQIDIQLAGG